jgi:hypothetical protein
MKRLTATLAGSTCALLLIGAAAQAAPIFNYNWSPDTEKHFADGFGPGDTDHYVDFSNEPPKDASVNPTSHKTHVVATNLKVFSSADDNTPDNINSNYSLTLVLQDIATGNSHSFVFSGNLQGSFSTGTSNIDNAFSGSTVGTWTDTNGDAFKVTMDTYTPPGPPNASLAGSVGATVFYTKGDKGTGGPPGGTGGHDSPEPSTLLLSFLGLSGAGMASWRRWRAGAKA